MTRFERFGDLSNLGSAINYANQAVSLTPGGDPELPIRLGNLGNSYSARFDESGHLADLDKAIPCHNQAVSLTPQGHPQQPIRLNNLGIAHRRRFDSLGDLKDLDLTIDYEGQAVSLTPEGHPERPQRLNSIGLAYVSRYEHLGHATDLNLAISSLSQSTLHTPEEHAHRPNRLKNLGDSYQSRFEHLKNLPDLDLAIFYLDQAISCTPEGHRGRPSLLNSLAISYQSRFERLGHRADLNKAIDYFSEVAELIPEGHRHTPTWLIHLSYVLRNRFNISCDPKDISSSLSYAERAAKTSAGRALTRFNAARTWGSLCAIQQTSPIEAYHQLVKLIPEVVWLGSTTNQRYENVSLVNNAVIEASTIAIELQNYDAALEWLEEGRSIVWNQLLQLRTPLDELAAIDSSLAEELEQVARDIEVSSGSHPSTKMNLEEASLEQAAQHHRRLAEQRELLIEQVRSLPGMSDFLRAKKSSRLLAASRTGAIAFINVHRRGCYAIIVRSPSAGVDCLSLANFTYEKASIACAQLTRNLRSQGRTSRSIVFNPEVAETVGDTLLMLWVDVAKPVLDFLGYTRNVSTDKLPHITWCTTGPLSFLPLHAAGDYGKPRCALFDYAISSYTPTLSALLAPAVDTTAHMGVLAIGQAHAPGLPSLPGTVAELDQVGLQIGHTTVFTRLEDHEATASAVLKALNDHSWVHFACHASQNTARPTASAFHLHNGPLSLTAITQKQLKNADLAFLSACETAAGDESMPEEAVHLAAGMIMAGYRRVIGTMWSINDEDAPLVAEKFYAYMLDEEAPSERKAAKALHHAVGCLRAKVGVESFGRWAPYIHIGL
ncbi:hypothetical protein FRC06_011802 [Ceratobasidium sp. 370]|nr:hypothetical protein FRC06_011802 [Ceratobasidium sp. 370]